MANFDTKSKVDARAINAAFTIANAVAVFSDNVKLAE